MKYTHLSKIQDILCCPKCHGKLETDSTGSSFNCQSDQSHSYRIINGIPRFVKREEISPEDAHWVFDYDETAEDYDRSVLVYNEWLGIDPVKEFKKAIEKIPVEPSSRILDVSTGTGNMIFRIVELHPETEIVFVGVDLSIGMLRVAQRKLSEARIAVPVLHTQVMELPFDDDSFDVVTHSGGINTFSDIPAALREWVRVLKPNGFLWIGDEGVSPALRKTRRGAEIMKENKLFGLQPPLRHLPPQVKNIGLRWWARDTFYTISCQKLSKEELREIHPLKVWFTAEI